MKIRLFLIIVLATGFVTTAVHAEKVTIPSWIKNNAKLWAKNQIDDSDFVKAIQYLIELDIIKVPQILPTSQQTNIPGWIKNNAKWWSDGTIGDNDFVKGIQYLVQVGIIKINQGQIFSLSSSAFENNGTIPRIFTCDGDNTSPPLEISSAPRGAKTLALIVDDPDAGPRTFVHWVLWNIATNKTEFVSGEKIQSPQGLNGRGNTGYMGPCPPFGIHHYYFKLYALDTELQFNSLPTKQDLESAMTNHILAQSILLGRYGKN